MLNQSDKLLQPVDDDLFTRSSQSYVLYKLNALKAYLSITSTAMRNKGWAERYFLDLQAGPGKDKFGEQVVLGSPLIALVIDHPFTQYRFNELNLEANEALQKRVQASPLANRVQIYQEDVNQVVDRVCEELHSQDIRAKKAGKWSTFNIAFLDPEGLELHWSTVEKLAQVTRMDLIINFSTGGILRSIGRGHSQAIDQFFGTDEWQSNNDIIQTVSTVKRRRALIDLYRERLKQFGYYIEVDPNLGGDDIAVSNSKNAQVYSMIFASKHPLGDKFWKQASKQAKPPKLPGF